MSARPGRFELVVDSAGGGRRSIRLGGLVFALIVAGMSAALVFLGAGILKLPARLSRSLQSREMDVLLARRVQLGERLRLLSARFDQLESQARHNEALVQRVRRLYGLPELARTSAPPRGAGSVPETIFTAAILHVGHLDAQIEELLSTTESLLVSLSRWEEEHPGEAESVPARMPIRAQEAVPTTLFGPAKEPFGVGMEFHAGLDLAAPKGTLIVAPASGIVRWAGDAPPNSGGPWWRLGQTVVLAHGDRFRTLFGHCDRILVRVGQRVEAGDPIATVGATGRAVSPRLHYEVRRLESDAGWRAVDPISVLLDLDRLETELGAPLSQRADLDASLAPPLPGAYTR